MNEKLSFRNRVAILGVVVALLASACGGSSDDAADADTETTTEETAEVETEEDDSSETEETEAEEEVEVQEEPEPEADEAEDEAAVDEPAEEVVEDDAADDFVVPAEYEALCAAGDQLEQDLLAAGDPLGSPQLIADAYTDFIALSPNDDLTEDLTLLSGVAGQIAEIMNDPDADFLDPNSPLLEEIEALSGPEVEAAAIRVEEVLAENCGTLLEGGGAVEEVLDETVSLDGPGEVTATLEFATFDVYEIDVPEGTLLTVTMADPTGFGVDTLLTIVEPDGNELTNDDVVGDPGDLDTFDSRIIIEEAVGGLYSIEARSFQGSGEGEYVLTVTFE